MKRKIMCRPVRAFWISGIMVPSQAFSLGWYAVRFQRTMI